MREQLLANIRVSLVFYRRNNLLLLVALLLVVFWGVTTVPGILVLNTTVKFDLVRRMVSTLGALIFVFSGALGLLNVSHHVRNRSLKMVITRPCRPDTWLLAVFLSAVGVSLALYLSLFLVGLALFMAWEIPFQWGLPFLVLDGFLEAVMFLSYLTFLAVLLHPVMAALVALLLQDGLFYFLMTWVLSGMSTSANATWKGILAVVYRAVYGLYLVLPTYSPFGDKTGAVTMSYRVTAGDAKYLLLTLGYVAVAASFFYIAADYALKRKRLS